MTTDIYYSWAFSNRRWDIRSSNIRKSLTNKKLFYSDNKLIGISSGEKKIKIKLLDKKKISKTLSGRSNRKDANTGVICANGPSRIQKPKLIEDIQHILNTSLDFYEHIGNLTELFQSKYDDSNIPIMITNVSNKLKVYIDGIDTEYSTPENIIIHYKFKSGDFEKPYKKTTISDFCVVITTLLRYKEYESMFDPSVTHNEKWFYNNEESNNKYKEIYND